jgi:hypothetical protein
MVCDGCRPTILEDEKERKMIVCDEDKRERRQEFLEKKKKNL